MKPTEVRQKIEKMFPTQKRIELFARCAADGWTAWGLDVLEEQAEGFKLTVTDMLVEVA